MGRQDSKKDSKGIKGDKDGKEIVKPVLSGEIKQGKEDNLLRQNKLLSTGGNGSPHMSTAILKVGDKTINNFSKKTMAEPRFE